MPEQSAGEKTEKATSKKREEARKKGNVAKSTEVNSALVLLTGTVVMAWTSSYFFGNLQVFMHGIFSNLNAYEVSQDSVRFYSMQTIFFLLKVIGPLILSILVIGTTANVLQIGFLISGESIKPDIKKLDIFKGLKRMVSAKSFAELVKGLLKITIIGIVIYITISGASKDFIPLMDQSLVQVISFLGKILLKVALRASIAMIILASLDYAFQRWEYEKSLRMSKDEVKQEYKEHEGDPLLKSRIRSIQRETAQKRMMSDVPNADVIITNPIHYAVALKYDSGEMSAPVVVAKGARKIAEKIKNIAKEHNIPIVEDPPLARALFKTCEIGMETPIELYKSVAEILAYVFRLKQQGMK
jgi:flagellar biosynthesis protein FlhB